MTIYALSTVPGKSGVAVIRVSGQLAKVAIKKLTKKVLKPREATLCKLYDHKDSVFDQAVVVFFEDKKSFTGEPVVEFQTHGSLSIISKLLDELSMIEGFRLAEPGEFTKRAYLGGKINLVQAEGLADLIDSETEKQREQALMHYGNLLSDKYFSWSEEIKTCLALIEASIDFSDEDIPKNLLNEIRKISLKIKVEINEFLKTNKNKKPGSFLGLWKRVVGADCAAKTDSVRFENNTLYIVVKNPYLKSDLISKKEKIIKKIKCLNRNIDNLIFD